MDYAVFVGIALISSVVSAVFGLGTALLVIAVGSCILPIKETIALATILFTAGTFTRTFVYREHIDWRLTALMTVFSVPFAYLGASALAVAPVDLLKTSLGSMALLYVVMAFSGWRPKFEMGRAALILGSAGYGFVSGLLGTGNVIKAIVFDHMGLRKEAFVGVMAATSVLANLTKIGSYVADGLIGERHLLPAAALVFCIVAVTILGRTLLQGVTPEHFRTGVLLILAAVSIGLLLG